MNPPPDVCQSDLNPRTNRSGFTLIELLVVITVIGILAAITLNIAGGVQQKAAMDKARAEIAAISNALEQYKNVKDYYPTNATTNAVNLSLTNTTTPEDSLMPFYQASIALTNDTGELLDPYGNPYQYQIPGTKNPASFDVWSKGKSSSDTTDDIGNW